MEHVFAAFAQFDNELRSQRTIAGMKATAAAGRWPWRPPVGFKRGLGGDLEHDPERAPFVRSAFERMAAGLGNANSIRREMNAQGFTTRAGRRLSIQTFRRMLQQPIYAGRIVVERYDVDVLSTFDGIVTQETFDRVQTRLSGLAYAPRRLDAGDVMFPLRRFAYCGAC